MQVICSYAIARAARSSRLVNLRGARKASQDPESEGEPV